MSEYIKAFIGYHKEDIRQFLEKENGAFRALLSQKQEILEQVKHENQVLEKQKSELTFKISEYQEAKRDLEHILSQGFLESCKLIYDCENEYNEMTDDKSSIVNQQKNKNDALKHQIQEFMSRLEHE